MAIGRFSQYIVMGAASVVMAGAVVAAGRGLAEQPARASSIRRAAPAWPETRGEAPPTGPAASTVRRAAPAAEGACRWSSVVGLADPGLCGRASLCVDAEGIRSAGRRNTSLRGCVHRMVRLLRSCGRLRHPRLPGRGRTGRGRRGCPGEDGRRHRERRDDLLRGEVRDLRPSLGAQITLLLFGNGVANSGDTRARAHQLLMPLWPGFGAPSDGGASALVG
jgi:hypothetical protein